MLKVVAALAVGAVLAGLGVHYAREHLKSAVDQAVDTSLPTVVVQHPWDPVVHGHARRAERVRFSGGAVSTVRCHATLGTYAVSITRNFTFSPTTQPVPAHCPGRPVRRAMGLATKVERTTARHRQTLTFTDQDGATVLVLVGRAT
jgi:hypothetical protein